MSAKDDDLEVTQIQKRESESTRSTSAPSGQNTLPDHGERVEHAHLSSIPVEFGRYRLEKVLGEGGMGRVFLAHDSQLDRHVALKVPRFPDSDAAALERFFREARAAALLRHPNICPIYDIGEHAGYCFLTMAFIEGDTLKSRTTSDNLLSQRDAARLVSKLAGAIHEAHTNNIVHRDLRQAFRDAACQAKSAGKVSHCRRFCERGLKYFPRDKDLQQLLQSAR